MKWAARISAAIAPMLIAVTFFFSVATAGEFQVTTAPSAERQPTWSVDGATLYFESNSSGSWHIYAVSAGGGSWTQITNGSTSELHCDISPDGTKIVFVRGIADAATGSMVTSSLWVKTLAGGAEAEIVPDNGKLNWHPSWSPDGSTIYFGRRQTSDGWDLYKVPSSGGSIVIVNSSSYDQIKPLVSPDGTTLGWTGRGGYALNVFEAPISDPLNATQLTFDTSNSSIDDFSPDSRYLVYSARRVRGYQEIFELDRVTLASERLTFDADTATQDTYTQYGAYSPDGTQLAFSSRRITGEENIWILDRPGVPVTENILSVGEGRGLPGTGVTLSVSLQNSGPTPAIQFKLEDVPDWITVTGARTMGRASGMTVSVADNGSAGVVLYHPTGGALTAGAGQILELELSIAEGATLADTVAMTPAEIMMSSVLGEALDVTGEAGHVVVQRVSGDINGDNLLDVGDLVRLAELVLDSGDPPTPEEFAEADCNDDAVVNVLDFPCEIKLILGSEKPLPLDLATAPSVMELAVWSKCPVRGIQVWLPTGSGYEVNAAGLDPMTIHSAVDRDGAPMLLAFDPGCQGWSAGDRVPFRVSSTPSRVRAYGPGGRPLVTEVTTDGIRISQPNVTLPGLRVLAAFPNPFRGSASVRFSTDRAGSASIEVFDIAGRRVSAIPAWAVTEGEHVWTWDAHDLNGAVVPRGVYFVRVRLGNEETTTRLLRIGG